MFKQEGGSTADQHGHHVFSMFRKLLFSAINTAWIKLPNGGNM